MSRGHWGSEGLETRRVRKGRYFGLAICKMRKSGRRPAQAAERLTIGSRHVAQSGTSVPCFKSLESPVEALGIFRRPIRTWDRDGLTLRRACTPERSPRMGFFKHDAPSKMSG
jgi:hypothetical protein